MDYKQILHNRLAFRLSAGSTSDDFNLLDIPGHKYFKILFHFDNGDSNFGNTSGGLLALPNNNIPLIDSSNSYTDYDSLKNDLRAQSSAWSYLVLNGEDERARLLLIFINLLLNISTQTPWYFQKISGLDLALERKAVLDKEMKIDEERQRISITCLPDAMDDRVGTLIDLYRSIVFSWIHKKEIVPANLRKFDMSIYIFETPNTQICKFLNNKSIDNQLDPQISYKYIEFHNCEIDYNSSKSGYGEVNNTEGFNSEYNIDIMFDDIYESRYNQWTKVKIGDMINSDKNNILYDPGKYRLSELIQEDINNQILGDWPNQPFSVGGFLKGAKDLLMGLGNKFIGDLINRVKLGNIYTFSLSNAKDKFKSFAEGNILNSVRNVSNVVRKFDNNKSREGVSGNIYKQLQENIDILKINKLGNLYSAKTTILNL